MKIHRKKYKIEVAKNVRFRCPKWLKGRKFMYTKDGIFDTVSNKLLLKIKTPTHLVKKLNKEFVINAEYVQNLWLMMKKQKQK